MPIVYACICPRAFNPGALKTERAVERVSDELHAIVPDVVVVIAAPEAKRHTIGVVTATHVDAWETDGELAASILATANDASIPGAALPRWDGIELAIPREAFAAARVVMTAVSALSAREHFDLGRAIAAVLAADARRIAVIGCGRLSAAHGPGKPGHVFDAHYRRAIEDWDVKWLSGLDPDTRRLAKEDTVAQTAILMGALRGSHIETRILSYEESEGVGLLVAAIDVLGDRRKKKRDA